jgi:hypothetical protein
MKANAAHEMGAGQYNPLAINICFISRFLEILRYCFSGT